MKDLTAFDYAHIQVAASLLSVHWDGTAVSEDTIIRAADRIAAKLVKSLPCAASGEGDGARGLAKGQSCQCADAINKAFPSE